MKKVEGGKKGMNVRIFEFAFFFLAGIFSFFSLFLPPPPAFSLHFSFRAKKEKNSFFTHPHKNPLPRGARAGAIWQFFLFFFVRLPGGGG